MALLRTLDSLAAGLAILLGGALLVWPSWLNGYPLVFIDTVSYLLHTTVPEVPWDKTQAYGPFLHLFHWQRSLWAPVLAQGLIASHLIWLTQAALWGRGHAGWHLALCAGLAGLTAAPWFLATLMPDSFTALVPLALFLLALGRLGPGATLWVGGLAVLGVAAHLSHLPLSLALLVLVALLARRLAPVLRAAAPVALAVLLLCTANLLAFGRFTPSPHGAAFLLARLQDDGPAARLLQARCPSAGWRLCAFADRLPMDSDAFLWDETSPLNREADGGPRPMGAMRGAAEAQAIVAATLAEYPGAVALAAARNALAQLLRMQVGDTLVPDHLAASARRAIAGQFPAEELAQFDAGAQARGALPALAAPLLLPHLPVLLAALIALPLLARRAWRQGPTAHLALLAFALVALLANAAVAGALSKPHHRYQARIVWLLPLAVGLVALPRRSAAQRAPGDQ
ncbi:hypothetical protein [Falsiroseomonas selenitidurans]|uniref:Glycosyltransferase RgtA/B/C/D-like domain-containing protein n=1 Tax=Falsiroseomonas selenitidurans TaxID=2716335 RepID=A0ABX1E2G5_9PROT|nr:hypothetical protein [Falsiroseomonas selenitidurans]NKC30008.1 hypothetical protein [Falsiroseomonas selenitidurans]